MKCFSCLEEINVDFGGPDGASLSGDEDDVQVCRGCWLQIPIQARIAIMLISRDTASGGIGLVDLLFALTDFAADFGQSDQGQGPPFAPGLN